jgi:RNA polymerase sigma factor (sigma-70 family)
VNYNPLWILSGQPQILIAKQVSATKNELSLIKNINFFLNYDNLASYPPQNCVTNDCMLKLVKGRSPMERDDAELIQRVLSGDENAFSVLVKKYQKGVHALAWRKVKDFHIAEEITQDAFLQAHKKLASLKNPSQFPGWLYVIADRLCRSWFRKRKLNMQSLESTSENVLEKTDYANYICEQREARAIEHQREIVQRLMAQLPESERTVMVLYYLGEMNCKEISKFLGVSSHTVKSRLRRARERLKDEEHLIHETLGSVPLSPSLSENIMRNIDRVKQTSPSGGKPLLPFAALGASAILVVLLMGASHQLIPNFQQPYSLALESETTIEIVDAPVVLDIRSKPSLQNRGGNGTIRDKNNSNGLSTGTESMPSNIAEDITQWHLPEKAKSRFGKGRKRGLTYFPDGTRLVVRSSIGLWIYDAHTGEEVDLFTGDPWDVITMALSSDGHTLAVASEKNIRLLDLHTRNQRDVLAGHKSDVDSLAFSPTGEILASGSEDTTIRLWDVDTGDLVRTLIGHTGVVQWVAFSPDGKMLASAGGGEDTICLWDVDTGKLLRTITGQPDRFYSFYYAPVAYAPDGLTLAGAGADSKIRLWDVSTGKLIKTITTDMKSVDTIVYSPDSETLASISEWHNNIYLWDVQTGERLKVLTGHTHTVDSIAYSPDGKTLASESDDGTVRFWDADTGELLKTISGHTFMARSVAFSPDGSTLASSEMADYTIILRDVQTGKILKTFVGHTDNPCSVRFSPDGETLASGSWNGPIRLWDVQTGELLKTLTGSDYIGAVAYSPGGRTLAAGGSEIYLWDVRTGELLRTLTGHKEGLSFLTYFPDGATLVSSSRDNTIRLWDVHTGKLLRTFTENLTKKPSISLSTDGDTLAVATDESVIRLWDTRTSKVTTPLIGHAHSVTSVAFSPNRSVLASAGRDAKIRLWNVATGERLLTFPEHPVRISAIAFSPDGQTIASGSWMEVYISDITTGTHTAIRTGHTRVVNCVAFSPDGQTLASGSNDSTVILWNVMDKDLRDNR